MALRDAVYGSAWKRVRLEVLERDHWLCRIQAEGCLVRATEVDHIVPWRVGGAVLDPGESADVVWAMQPLSGSCVVEAVPEAAVEGVVTGPTVAVRLMAFTETP
jgi:hypothetical protein